MAPYTSIVDSIAANGSRHVQRGLDHYASGRPEYAAGSFKKALRNYIKAARSGALFASQAKIEALAAWMLRAEVARLKRQK